MIWRFSAIGALVACAAILSGCASVDPSGAFSDVRQTVSARTGQKIQWIRGTAEDEQVEQAIQALLQRELTADAAAQIALLNNRELQATFEEIGVSQADLVQAGLLRNPSFSTFVGFSSHGPPPDAAPSFAVGFDFLEAAILPLRKRIAEQQLEQTKLRVTDAVLRLVAEVKAAHITLQARRQLVTRLRLILEINQAAAELAQRQHDAGNINDLDLQNQQALYNRSRVDVAEAEALARADREKLNRLMGLWGVNTAWTVADRLPALPEKEITPGGLESLAIAQRLDLAAARRQVDQVDRLLALQQGTRYFPAGVHLGVSTEREPDPGGPWNTGPTLDLELPIFDQGQPRIARLQAQQRQVQRLMEALAVRIRSEVREARDLMIAKRDIAEYYNKVLLPQRVAILNLTLEQYNFMLKGAYDLLLARQAETETERAYVEALRDYWLARTELERAVGGRLSMDGSFTGSAAPPPPGKPAEKHQMPGMPGMDMERQP